MCPLHQNQDRSHLSTKQSAHINPFLRTDCRQTNNAKRSRLAAQGYQSTGSVLGFFFFCLSSPGAPARPLANVAVRQSCFASMGDQERGAKRSAPEPSEDHQEQRLEKSSAAASHSAEHPGSPAQRIVKASSDPPLRSGEGTSDAHLVAGQRALDTILQRLTTATPRTAIDSFVLLRLLASLISCVGYSATLV